MVVATVVAEKEVGVKEVATATVEMVAGVKEVATVGVGKVVGVKEVEGRWRQGRRWRWCRIDQ